MTFDELLHAGHDTPTVALFYGASCAPCERLKPKLKSVCENNNLRLETFNSASELPVLRRLGIRSVPAVVVVQEGLPHIAFSGDLAESEIAKRLKQTGVNVWTL